MQISLSTGCIITIQCSKEALQRHNMYDLLGITRGDILQYCHNILVKFNCENHKQCFSRSFCPDDFCLVANYHVIFIMEVKTALPGPLEV